jgi:hypothetical protein
MVTVQARGTAPSYHFRLAFSSAARVGFSRQLPRLIHTMRTVILCALVIQVTTPASGPPKLEDYPAKDIFHGEPAAPVLAAKETRMFRTELRRQAALGPNFAGHYTMALWGCGAGCANGAVIDARSGQVWIIPFYFEDVWEGGHIVCGHGSTFDIASELLIISGRLSPGGKVGQHYFRWHDGKFTPVYFDPACSI